MLCKQWPFKYCKLCFFFLKKLGTCSVNKFGTTRELARNADSQVPTQVVSQNLHFNKILRLFIYILRFEKYYFRTYWLWLEKVKFKCRFLLCARKIITSVTFMYLNYCSRQARMHMEVFVSFTVQKKVKCFNPAGGKFMINIS